MPENLLEEVYQCQCGPGRKPDGAGKCIEGKKILHDTFCVTDEECEEQFSDSGKGSIVTNRIQGLFKPAIEEKRTTAAQAVANSPHLK